MSVIDEVEIGEMPRIFTYMCLHITFDLRLSLFIKRHGFLPSAYLRLLYQSINSMMA